MISVILINITLIIVTFLFNIIWYKFKSHNRFEGFKYLISHEIDYIKRENLETLEKKEEYIKYLKEQIENDITILNPEARQEKINKLLNKKEKYIPYEFVVDYKLYIKYYKSFIPEEKLKPNINNLACFISCMSRLSDSYLVNRNLKDYELKEKVVSSISKKSKFVFDISDRFYDKISINNYDSKFMEKIIWEIFGSREKKLRVLNTYGLLFHKAFWPTQNNYFGIDEKYATMSWKYPKTITRIAFLSIISLVSLSLYFLVSNYNFTFKITENTEFLPVFSFGINIIILIIWHFKFINKLKDLLYGRYSIEGYVWKFFVFRIQYLNRIDKLIPIYFSRNFSRFYKTNLVLRHIDLKVSSNKNRTGVVKEILGYENNDKDKLILNYITNLSLYKSFEEGEIEIHNVIFEDVRIN